MSTKAVRDSVLVIDDDPFLRELIAAIGKSCDIRILQAADCASGLKILERESSQIRMILLDYFMPGMQPIQCANEIVSKAGTIPVVLVTAAVDPSARAAELKLTRWLSKPFSAETMKHLITEKPIARKSRR